MATASSKKQSFPTSPEEDVVMSFKHIGISQVHPPHLILSNVSGYIKRGGITAVMGPSASGKSLLMQVFSGRIHDLSVTGEFILDGEEVDQNDISNSVGYVPQDDILMGELTSREVLRNSAAMKRNKSMDHIEADVDRLLNALGLGKVADNPIGTPFVRGLSGGQKKRVDIGVELVAAPMVLFLDEPTSGLDASIAFEVLATIRSIVRASAGKLSVMLSIHQPNSRILELFDHIMLLGGGGMTFFGTVPESIEYFSSVGFPPPQEYTPTDYFLQVSDPHFGSRGDFNFEGSFSTSIQANKLMAFLDRVKREGALNVKIKGKKVQTRRASFGVIEQGMAEGSMKQKMLEIGEDPEKTAGYEDFVDTSHGTTSFWRQYYILVKRDLTLAVRDPALYYLQFVLVLAFGFLVGAAFFSLKYEIGSSQQNIPASMLWIVLMMAYIQTFKVYHISRGNARFKHERANNTYGVLAAFLAETTTTAIGLTTFIPGAAVAYFMMGYPNKGFPFLMLLFWLTAFTAESMINSMSKFHPDATVNIVLAQAVFVIITVFGGGVFIPWNKTPNYWFWLQELSIFTQASRSAITHIMDLVTFKCTLNEYGMCYDALGRYYECDRMGDDNYHCMVEGREVLYKMQGTVPERSHWTSFGYLVLLFTCYRLSILFFMYLPVERIVYLVKAWWSSGISEEVLRAMISLRRIEGQLSTLIGHKYSALETAVDVASADDVESQNATARSMNTGDVIPLKDEREFDYLFAQGGVEDHDNIAVSEKSKPSFVLEWKNLSLMLKKNGNVLIDNVSGVARSGRILALMGPSGAGKTTLLNALGNRAPYARIEGEISFGKRKFTASDLFFVPQFDEVNGNFTVSEQLELVGLLKCRDTDAMYHRLASLLRILGLHAKARTLCSELSGGELKRVSVGMGMISNPSVLFLDEPTTGLDSAAAFSIVKHLVELAESMNVAVIMTIHQPAEMVFDMLQDLYLLEAGRLSYYGPLGATKKYFANLGYECSTCSGLSDFYLDLIYRPPTKHESGWKELYMDSTFGKNVQIQTAKIVAASSASNVAEPGPDIHVRFWVQLEHFFKYYSRDPGFYLLRVFCLIVIAFFISTLFLQLRAYTDILPQYAGAVFFNIWTVLFSAVAATGLMARDRRVAIEQIKNAVVSPAVYCLAQLVASLPFNFIAALTFQSIFHWLSNINPDGESFIYAVLITCGHLLLMEASMLAVVQVLQNAMLSVTFAMVVLGSFFLFSGFFIRVENMPPWIGWICYIIPTKYSFDGYLYMIFHSQDFTITHMGSLLSGDEVLDKVFGQTDVKPWPMFGTLLAWIALIRLGHYAALAWEVLPYMKKD